MPPCWSGPGSWNGPSPRGRRRAEGPPGPRRGGAGRRRTGPRPRPGPEGDLGQRRRQASWPEEAGRGSYPLLAERERLERAGASALAGPGPGEEGAGGSWQGGGAWERARPGELPLPVRGGGRSPSLEGGRGSWIPWLEGEGRPAPAFGAQDWAEQADRAFRRDGRRYDGGFYLY